MPHLVFFFSQEVALKAARSVRNRSLAHAWHPTPERDFSAALSNLGISCRVPPFAEDFAHQSRLTFVK